MVSIKASSYLNIWAALSGTGEHDPTADALQLSLLLFALSTHVKVRPPDFETCHITFSADIQKTAFRKLRMLNHSSSIEDLRVPPGNRLKAFETRCGIKAVTCSPEDHEALKETGTAAQAQLAGQNYSKELMNDMLEALEVYRKQ